MESENTAAADSSIKHENSPRKRFRHRKKQLYENIMKQMEFYFSDANLSKDRYLGDLVNNDPFVSLSEFLKFNKIRSMTQDVNDIVKAMKHSTFLELSEDKLKVKRKSPMMPYDADLRTVYVESIPVTASLEWLERVFSDYGKVAYISLPKFKNSTKIKGFAFIEFARPQDAQKCVNAFIKMGCKLPSCMPPDELSSIKMFSVDNAEENPDSQNEVKEEYEPPKKKTKKKEKKPPKSLDLKHDQESDNEKRIDTPTEENKSVTTPSEEGKTTDIESKDGVTSQDESKTSNGTPRKKKVKKRSSKEKGKSKALAKGEAPKGALWGLQVLAKSEWKSLRNKYLNLQRKYMKDVKSNLQNKKYSYSSIPAPAAPSMETETEFALPNAAKTANELLIDNVPLKTENTTVFLGMTLDTKLQWSTHITALAGKLSSAAYAIRKIRQFTDVETAKLVYFAYFHSIMSYGIMLWGKCADIEKNFVLQKRAIRGIYNLRPRESLREKFKETVNNTQEIESAKNVEPLQKIPGVFVKETLPEPCLDVRLTKRTIKSNIHVLHVDVKEGQSEAIIRFDSSKAADEYSSNSSNRARVMCGAEEQEQWRRAESARAGKRVRGRTRLLARAAALSEQSALTPASPQPTHTHIRFDDE